MKETTRIIRLEDCDLSYVNLTPEMRHPEETWQVEPLGHVKTPELVLKLYDLRVEGGPINKGREGISEFIKERVEREEIAPYSGVGFAIDSEDYLNVCRWEGSGGCERIIVSQVYQWPERKKLNVEEDGAFCDGEKLIYDFEAGIWNAAMNIISQQGKEKAGSAVKEYLEAFLVRQ